MFEFRGQAVKACSRFWELRAASWEHYAELDKRIEVVRDRVVGADGRAATRVSMGLYEEALEDMVWTVSGDGNSAEGEEAEKGFVEKDGVDDVFEALRQRNVEDGILTDIGSRDRILWRFNPVRFTVVWSGEIIYTFNEALRRMEDRSSLYLAGGGTGACEVGGAVLLRG